MRRVIRRNCSETLDVQLDQDEVQFVVYVISRPINNIYETSYESSLTCIPIIFYDGYIVIKYRGSC